MWFDLYQDLYLKKIFAPDLTAKLAAETKLILGKIIISFLLNPIDKNARCIAAVPLEQV